MKEMATVLKDKGLNESNLENAYKRDDNKVQVEVWFFCEWDEGKWREYTGKVCKSPGEIIRNQCEQNSITVFKPEKMEVEDQVLRETFTLQVQAFMVWLLLKMLEWKIQLPIPNIV